MMTSHMKNFGSECNLSEAFLKKIVAS